VPYGSIRGGTRLGGRPSSRFRRTSLPLFGRVNARIVDNQFHAQDRHLTREPRNSPVPSPFANTPLKFLMTLLASEGIPFLHY